MIQVDGDMNNLLLPNLHGKCKHCHYSQILKHKAMPVAIRAVIFEWALISAHINPNIVYHT